MMIRLDHGLAYVEADLAFRGKTLHLDSVNTGLPLRRHGAAYRL